MLVGGSSQVRRPKNVPAESCHGSHSAALRLCSRGVSWEIEQMSAAVFIRMRMGHMAVCARAAHTPELTWMPRTHMMQHVLLSLPDYTDGSSHHPQSHLHIDRLSHSTFGAFCRACVHPTHPSFASSPLQSVGPVTRHTRQTPHARAARDRGDTRGRLCRTHGHAPATAAAPGGRADLAATCDIVTGAAV